MRNSEVGTTLKYTVVFAQVNVVFFYG